MISISDSFIDWADLVTTQTLFSVLVQFNGARGFSAIWRGFDTRNQSLALFNQFVNVTFSEFAIDEIEQQVIQIDGSTKVVFDRCTFSKFRQLAF